jgi:hypothetical protein
MRIWYVVGQTEYWLQPDLTVTKDGRFRVLGLKLISNDGKFKGYWHWKDVPLDVKRRVRSDVGEHLKRERRELEGQRRLLQALHRTNKSKK